MEQLEWNQGPFQGPDPYSSWNETRRRKPVVSRNSDSILTSKILPLFLPPIAAAAASAARRKIAGGHYGSRTHNLSGAT